MELLRKVYTSARYVARIMNEIGIESTKDLSMITIKTLTSTIENVNKPFGGQIGTQSIYFPPIEF